MAILVPDVFMFAPPILILAAFAAEPSATIKLHRLGLHEGAVLAAAVDADGKRAVTGGMDRRLIVWDLQSQRQVNRCCEHPEEVCAIAFGGEPDLLYTVAADRQIRECKLSQGTLGRSLGGHDKRVFAIAAPMGDPSVYAVDADGQLRGWNRQGGQSPLILAKDRRALHAVVADASGKSVFIAGEDRRITRASRTEGGPSADFTGSQDIVHALAVTPDGDRLLSAGSDKFVRLWDARCGTETRRWEGFGERIYALAVVGDHAFVGGPNGKLAVWDFQKNEPIAQTKMLAGVLTAAASPKGKSVVLGLADGSVWTASVAEGSGDVGAE
jgi:WD40 repeat protein